MINNIEEISKFNQERLKQTKLICNKRKKIKGLTFKETLLKVNNRNREGNYKMYKYKKIKKENNHKEVKFEEPNVEEMSGIFIDEFC